MENIYSVSVIKEGLLKLFPNAEFYITENGDLTMWSGVNPNVSIKFIDHTWPAGTFIND